MKGIIIHLKVYPPAWKIFITIQQTSGSIQCVPCVVNCRTLNLQKITVITLYINMKIYNIYFFKLPSGIK